jgi:hypothetical protein
MRHWVTGITYTMNKIKIGVRGNKIKITLHAFAARTHSHIIQLPWTESEISAAPGG